jgi:hypothetical protein
VLLIKKYNNNENKKKKKKKKNPTLIPTMLPHSVSYSACTVRGCLCVNAYVQIFFSPTHSISLFTILLLCAATHTRFFFSLCVSLSTFLILRPQKTAKFFTSATMHVTPGW